MCQKILQSQVLDLHQWNVSSFCDIINFHFLNPFICTVSKRSDWLLKGTVSEYSHDKCKHEFGKIGFEIIESQLCALNDKGVDSCRGDSGGPVSYEKNNIYYLYGITSFGIGCGSELPSVYTKVNRYLDWIEEEMSAFE